MQAAATAVVGSALNGFFPNARTPAVIAEQTHQTCRSFGVEGYGQAVSRLGSTYLPPVVSKATPDRTTR